MSHLVDKLLESERDYKPFYTTELENNICNIVSLLILYAMTKIADILKEMKRNPKGIKFSDLCKVCDQYFGSPRQSGTSHRVYKTPWIGDPRVNIQKDGNKAKAYQVKQVLRAIERIQNEH